MLKLKHLPLFSVLIIGLLFAANRFTNVDPFLYERPIFMLLLGGVLVIYATNKAFVMTWKALVLLLLLLLLVLLSVSYHFNATHPAPIVFLFCWVLAAFLLLREPIMTPLIRERVYIWMYWGLCLILGGLALTGGWDDGRYVGFGVSATTFGIWLLAVYLVAFGYCFDYRNRCLPSRGALVALVALVVASLYIYLSGTRTNLLACSLLFIFLIFPKFTYYKASRVFATILLLLLVMLVYSLYGWLQEVLPKELIAYRYDGEVDGSFYTRHLFFDLIYDKFASGNWSSILFGNGIDASRRYLTEYFGRDTYPHNDLLRILFDYGVVFVVFFCGFLIYISARSVYSFLICVIYIFSFMHNMVFSHYLMLLLVFYSHRKMSTREPVVI